MLAAEGRVETVRVRTSTGPVNRVWTYPSRDDCLKCHTTLGGFVLGPKTRQLNSDDVYEQTGIRDEQLRVWNALGMFSTPIDESKISRMDKLVSLDDERAPLVLRVRSYLDSNCQNCHRPGANIPSAFDARFDIPLYAQKLINAPTMSDSLGIANPRVVAPGDLSRSLLYQRMIQTERFKMPPVARSLVDRSAARVLAEWIQTLSRK